MANKTINDFTALAAPVAADYVLAWDASGSVTRKLTVGNLLAVGDAATAVTHSSPAALTVDSTTDTWVVTITANITSLALSGMADGATVQIFLIGGVGADETADLSNVDSATGTALPTVTIYEDTVIEVIVTRQGSNYWGAYKTRDAGSAPGPSVPGVPSFPSAGTATSSTMPLTWDAPASDGGAAITDYIVQYRRTADAGAFDTFAHAASSNTSTTVTGLLANTGYDFKVAAFNSAGTGTFTATVSASTASSTFPTVSMFGEIATTGLSYGIALDATVENGDYLLVAISTGASTNYDLSANNPIAGSTRMGSGFEAATAYAAQVGLWFLPLTTSDRSTTKTVTLHGSDAAAQSALAWCKVSGANATPSGGTAVTGNNTSVTWTTSINPSAITTTANNCLVFVAMGWRRSVTTLISSGSAGYTEIGSWSGSYDQGIWFGYRQFAVAGSEDPGAITLDQTASMAYCVGAMKP